MDRNLLPVDRLTTELHESSLALLLTLVSGDSIDGLPTRLAELTGDERALDDGRARAVAQGLASNEPDGLSVDPRVVYLVAVAAAPAATIVEIIQVADDRYRLTGLVDPTVVTDRLATIVGPLSASSGPTPAP